MGEAAEGRFYDTVPLFDAFEGVADEANYRPLPDGWVLAVADIVNSTGAIADGRYKTVNMAGASVISALMNVLEEKTMPFVFGGDGALAALPASMADRAHGALAAVRTWVAEELGLELRAALVPVSDIRAHGLDMRVARFKTSDEVSYAMFAGGGASWAEAAMKAGRYHVDAAPAGSRPDLTGLSCRWNPIQSRHGTIASIIAVPGPKGNGPEFQQLIADVVALADEEDRHGHPVPVLGPDPRFSFVGIDAEARAAAPKEKRLGARVWITLQTLVLFVCLKMGWNLGTFDTTRYRRDLADNTDFRKFDDGLKMTVDISAARLERIEARLQRAMAEGVCHYGLHQQDSALMTCIVPTPMSRDHMHFVDGASGGYAVAASKLKATLARIGSAEKDAGGAA
ncbi:MAG TPA: DUF3095 domain-containing protein [Ensifer sp.]|jgi:hypothetical protein|uniref:DUF3095 domain-containing protein n=1 Tax=Ensifer sp. TaxID=1872086 RepID=UPI002E11D383|nr:DUF3095 domain-containing protein [Ensifer sp.]